MALYMMNDRPAIKQVPKKQTTIACPNIQNTMKAASNRQAAIVPSTIETKILMIAESVFICQKRLYALETK